MNLTKNDFVTEISGISALDEIISAEIGTPCLLIVKADENTTVCDREKTADFLRNADFISALACENAENGFSDLFDMIIPYENTDEYAQKLFKERTPYQAAEITACFVKARKGTSDDVLECESKAFYRLMNKKAEVN